MGNEIDGLRSRNLVWHYTTLEALQQILEGNTLLATEVSYQNDPREPDTARELIDAALSVLGDNPKYERFAHAAQHWLSEWRRSNGFLNGRVGELIGNSRFIFCASTDPDNLYAWRTYAAASRTGCAIGLDPTVPLGMIGTEGVGAIKNGSSTAAATVWTEVVYDPMQRVQFALDKLAAVGDAWNEQDRLSSLTAAQLQQDHVSDRFSTTPDPVLVMIHELADAVSGITAIAKHQSFKDEREMRTTFADVASGIVFTPGANGPRPRIRLAVGAKWGQVMTAARSRLPIRAVVLAPNARREAATTTQWLLFANNYPLDPEQSIDESGPAPVIRSDASTMIGIYKSEHPYQDV